jgi:hypothetical protein
MDFAADNITRGQEFFDRIFLAEGLAHIAENIFDQLDGETLANCETVSESWQQFVINNGKLFCKLWKRQYLQKLAKPGTDAHRLIQSNPKLFQYFDQAEQGTFHIFIRIGMTCKFSKISLEIQNKFFLELLEKLFSRNLRNSRSNLDSLIAFCILPNSKIQNAIREF